MPSATFFQWSLFWLICANSSPSPVFSVVGIEHEPESSESTAPRGAAVRLKMILAS
jgi:hypothetical protein